MKKIKLLIVPIVIVLLLGIGYELFFVRNKDKIVTNSIDSLFTTIEKNIDEADALMPKKTEDESILHLKQNINVDTNLKGLETLSKLTWKVDTFLNLEKEQIQLELGALENDKEIIGALVQIIKNEILIKSDALISPYKMVNDYSFLEIDEDLPSMNVDLKPINNIIKTIHKSFLDNISTDRITQTTEEITIRDKKVSVLANKYSINQTEAQKLAKAMINNLRTNNMDDLVTLTNTNKETIREYLDSFLKELEEIEEESEETIDLIIYSSPYMGKFKGFKFTVPEEETGFSYLMNDNEGEIVIKGDEDIKITIDKEGKKYTFKTTIEEVKLTVEYTSESKEQANLNISVTSDDVTASIKSNATIKKEDNGLRNNNEAEVKIKVDGEEYSFKLKMDGITEYDKVFPEKINNAKNFDYITEDELNKNLERIESKLKGTSLEKLINELAGATSY